MNIGQRIKEERIKKGITQDDLARLVGYTGKSMISRIEHGKTNPSYEALHKIASALGTTEAALFEYDIPTQIALERERVEEMKRWLSTLPADLREEQEAAISILEESIEDQALALSLLSKKEESPPPATRDELSELIDGLTDQQKAEAIQILRYVLQKGRE